MIQNTKYKSLLSLLILLLWVAGFSSCSKDEKDAASSRVELLSFGPTGVKPGGEIKFIGHNLNKVTAIRFSGTDAVVDQAAFSSQSASLITLVVPQFAERGKVVLQTADGEITSKAIFDLDIAPTITSITAEARPGENITLNGNFLNWVTSVTFNDGKVVTEFVSQSIDKLVVKVPDDAQTGVLKIGFSGTESGDFKSDQSVVVTLPMITSIAPVAAKHATDISITGTNLDLVKKIYFNNVANSVTSFVSQTATKIVVKVPASTTKGKLKVEAASGLQTESPADLDVVLPAISGLSPNPVEPTKNLTITGTNLDLVTAILFENVTSLVTSFVSQSATEIVVKVPTGIANGLVTFNVLNSTLKVKSSTILQIAGAAPPPTIALHIYNDAIVNWTGWMGGWGGTKDLNNSTPVRVGTKSIKVDYTAGSWGSPIQFGAGNISLAPYTMFKLSVYPTAATAGKTLTVRFNGDFSMGGSIVLGNAGEWKDFAIPISSITTAANATEIIIQDANGVGGTVYIDEIGFN